MPKPKESKIKELLFAVSPSGIVMNILAKDGKGNDWMGGFSHPEEWIAEYIRPYLIEHPNEPNTTHQVIHQRFTTKKAISESTASNYLGFHDGIVAMLDRLDPSCKLVQYTLPDAEHESLQDTEILETLAPQSKGSITIKTLTPQEALALVETSREAFKKQLDLPENCPITAYSYKPEATITVRHNKGKMQGPDKGREH